MYQIFKTVNIAENNLINTKAPLVKISIWITEKIIYCKECEDEVNQKDILPNKNTKNNKNLFRLLKNCTWKECEDKVNQKGYLVKDQYLSMQFLDLCWDSCGKY